MVYLFILFCLILHALSHVCLYPILGAYGAAVLYRKKDDDSLVILKEINMHDLTANERQMALNEVNVGVCIGVWVGVCGGVARVCWGVHGWWCSLQG